MRMSIAAGIGFVCNLRNYSVGAQGVGTDDLRHLSDVNIPVMTIVMVRFLLDPSETGLSSADDRCFHALGIVGSNSLRRLGATATGT